MQKINTEKVQNLIKENVCDKNEKNNLEKLTHKFELDNNYNRISISKYQELINNIKKIGGKKPEEENKLEIVKDQLVYQYDINDIKQNIEIISCMIITLQVKILSIYLDKEKEEGEGNEKKIFLCRKRKFRKNGIN